jgi:hypothetical protein
MWPNVTNLRLNNLKNVTVLWTYVGQDNKPLNMSRGPRSSTVGWDTALQARRSQVRFPVLLLEFFIEINLPVALWLWGWLSLYQEYFLGGEGGWCVGLITVPLSRVSCLEIWDSQPAGTVMACPGIYRNLKKYMYKSNTLYCTMHWGGVFSFVVRHTVLNI